MNDDKLMTTVKEPFAGVRMDTPVEQIMSRGRAVRARRRIPGAAGIPASVTVGHINPACKRYAGPVRTHGYQQSSTAAPGSKTPSHIIIDPSALPKGAGLEIAVQLPRPGGVQGLAGLVQASPACTGS